MSFFCLFSKIKHLCKWHIPAFHPPCVLTTYVWLLTVSLLLTWSSCSGCSHSLVCLYSRGRTWWEGRKTNSWYRIPAWSSPPGHQDGHPHRQGDQSWTLFPSPHEIYPTLNRPSHYWRGHWCIWLVRKLWRNPSVLAFGWIFISFMGFFCPKESFTLMWNNARSGLFGDFSRKLSSLSLILISCCRKSGITARKSVKLSLWKLMYETRGLWSPAAMEMNSLPASPLPLDANTAGISRHSDVALNIVCLNTVPRLWKVAPHMIILTR